MVAGSVEFLSVSLSLSALSAVSLSHLSRVCPPVAVPALRAPAPDGVTISYMCGRVYGVQGAWWRTDMDLMEHILRQRTLYVLVEYV